jgi:hypothetical protein
MDSGSKRKMLERLKKEYKPLPCDICGKPLSFEESYQMHMICSTNPKDRFCGETVFCCDSHSPEERYDFIKKRREEEEKIKRR